MKKKQKMVRVLAIVLAVLMAGGAIVSILLGFAQAEEMEIRNQTEVKIEYLKEEQALRMTQRLVYANTSAHTLKQLSFYVPANLQLKPSTLPYEGETLTLAYQTGYIPSGIEITSVLLDGKDASWAYEEGMEFFLNLDCEIKPNECKVIEFEYVLYLSSNQAFIGTSQHETRLRDPFIFLAAINEDGSFRLNEALMFTRWMDAEPMDMTIDIALPESYQLAASGEIETENGNYTIRAQAARDFSLVFGEKFKEARSETASGIKLRSLTRARGAGEELLKIASRAIEFCEQSLGTLPCKGLEFVQTGCTDAVTTGTGCMWLSEELLTEGGFALEHAIYSFVAAQYFGCAAHGRAVDDAWLSDALSEYVAYLIYEDTHGYDAYLRALNDYIVPSIQFTMPGGLNVQSNAALFTKGEYDIIVQDRGTVVFHELRVAMGRDKLIKGFRLFYERGKDGTELSEKMLVEALNAADGKSWEGFLTDWVFNVGEYVNQSIDWLD